MNDPVDLTVAMQREAQKRLRRNLFTRTACDRLAIADRLQQEAYRLLQSNPAAWHAFIKRNHHRRRVGSTDHPPLPPRDRS